MSRKYILVILILPLSVFAQHVITSGGETSPDGTLSYTIGETITYFSNLSDAGLLTEFENGVANKINICPQNIEIINNFNKDEIIVSFNPCYNYNGLYYTIYLSSGICYLKKRIIIPNFRLNYSDFPRGILLFIISEDTRIIKTHKIIH